MTDTAPRLEMRGIRKAFGGVDVLREVELTVAAGEVLALLGSNGAGKSTLVKILAGSYGRDAGTVRLDGGRGQLRPAAPGRGRRGAPAAAGDLGDPGHDRGREHLHRRPADARRPRLPGGRHGGDAPPGGGAAAAAGLSGHRPRRPGQGPERAGAADRRDRPRPGRQGARADHGRADGVADRAGGGDAVRHHPPAEGAGRRGDLHLALPVRGVRGVRPHRRAA